jgi:hypothetical protein
MRSLFSVESAIFLAIAILALGKYNFFMVREDLCDYPRKQLLQEGE